MVFENCEDCEKELAKCRETVSKAKEEKLNSCEKEKKQEVEKNKKLQKQLMRWTIGAAIASAVLGKELVDKITEAFSSAEKAVQTINPNTIIDSFNSGESDNNNDNKNQDKNEDKEEKKEKARDDVSFAPIDPDPFKTKYAYGGGVGITDYFDVGLDNNLYDYLYIQNSTILEMITSENVSDMISFMSLDLGSTDMNYSGLSSEYSEAYLFSPPPLNVPSPGTILVMLGYPYIQARTRRR